MSLPRLTELIFGIATAVGQIIFVVWLIVSAFPKDLFESIMASLFGLLLPALMVFAGSYAHVVDRKGYGRVILGFGALVMGSLGLATLLFGGLVYLYGPALASVMLLPDVTALVAFVASLFPDSNPSADSQRRLS